MAHVLKRPAVLTGQVLTLVLLFTFPLLQPLALASASIPPLWSIVADDFESGALDAWKKVSPGSISLLPGGGPDGSTALSVTVGQSASYLYEPDTAREKEGYLTFWFDPNGVSLPEQGITWIPSKSIRIADIKGSQAWHVLVGLCLRRPAGQGYKAYLEWRTPAGSQYDYASGEFDLVDGWQKITLGYHVDEWVAVWLNGDLMREIVGVDHSESLGEIVVIGNDKSTVSTPSGAIRYDDVVFGIPRITDLWVDAVNGDDDNDGLVSSSALRTIQKAADMAGPGTVVHIQPGVYRETVSPRMSGSAGEQARYLAEGGPGTAIIRGSEPASSLAWTQLASNSIGLPSGVDPTKIYYTDLSTWALDYPPRFIVKLDAGGSVSARLPLAREPDWEVATEWKYHEFWWAADGGSSVASCDPATNTDRNCDYPSRSLTQLTDRTNDAGPSGIEPGNLTTLGNLTGATLVALDTVQGHYTYLRTITSHSVSAGRITVDEICEHNRGSGEPGLGWGTKYYVEGKPNLLDTPGEWWYDASSGRLYLWPLSPGNPASQNLELSRRDNGFNLSQLSYITLEGLVLEFFNGTAVYEHNWREARSSGNVVRDATLRYANAGLYLGQGTGDIAANITDGFRLESSEIAHMDTWAINLNYWSENGSAFNRPGIQNTVIRNNELHHLGFRSDFDNAMGVHFSYADKLRFEGNYVHHVAQNGVQFNRSIIQSSKTYDFDPDEIKTGEILIKDNLFEKACQLNADCGGLKIWGDPPDGHVFRDVLVTGNVFRDTFGWAYVSAKRFRWSGGSSSDIRGLGGFGLYVDMASGIHVYRNISYNNAWANHFLNGVWRDGDVVYYNNIAANSLYGFRLDGPEYDTHGGSLNTQIANNILVNNEAYGILQSDNDGVFGNLSFDYNLYFNNGWRSYEDGGLYAPGAMRIYLDSLPNRQYQTLAEIQANTPWEDHGVAGDPRFQAYDVNDHNLHDGSWPDFHLTAQSSTARDKGTTALPASLTALLTHFGVDPSYEGAAFDIGRYEYEGGFVKTSDTLFVADHTPGSSNPYISHYTDALDDLGHGHDVWDTGLRGAPDGSILNQYLDGVIIWSVPERSGYLQDAGVQSSLQAYLDGGGRLLISGQDVAYMTRSSAFLSDYLHASYVQDSSGAQTLKGTSGDPIGNGLTLDIQGGDGANNQSSTDLIAPLGPAWPAFIYEGTASGAAGLRVNTGAYKVAFFAFGFEGIDSSTDRATVMQRTLDWLAGPSTVVQLGLSSGWNLSSWPLEPLIPAVDGALRTIEGRYNRVLGESGVYDCTLDPVYHSLKELHAGQAYYLRLAGSTGADLWIEGACVPVDTPLPLHEFWNWVGFLPETPLPVAAALESIEGKYLMVHSIDQTYNPAEPIYSTLTHMEPGQGYLIRATEPVDLIYPSVGTSAQVSGNQVSTGACDALSPTPYFTVVYGEVTVGDTPAPAGTVVQVVSAAGELAGCFVVQQQHAGHYGYMHVYGQEGEVLPISGLQEGELLIFQVDGTPAVGQPELLWANDPTPHRVDLYLVRYPAYVPMVGAEH